MKKILNNSELQSGTWQLLTQEIKEEIKRLQRKLEADREIVETSIIRGQIKAYRAILGLEKEDPKFK